MTFQPSSAAQPDYASPTVSLAALRARVSSATLSLHQTLDEVMGTFDQHLQELNKLRESLRESEKALQSEAPTVAALLPTLPALSPQVPAMTSPTAPAKPFVPAPRPLPVKQAAPPLMTQVLWPSLPATPPPPVPPEDAKAAARPTEPPLEDATLEELNAALAYAFAQVSGTKPLTRESITQMMPGPLPTSALRYGNPAELSGRP
jgi:hypothetical protein